MIVSPCAQVDPMEWVQIKQMGALAHHVVAIVVFAEILRHASSVPTTSTSQKASELPTVRCTSIMQACFLQDAVAFVPRPSSTI